MTQQLDQRVWGVVPAAGIGSRMNSDLPKQYLSLLDKAVIEYTLERLLGVAAIETITVALHPNDEYFAHLSIAKHSRIYTVTGGAERSNSVLSALISLQDKAHSSDWVLVHDAARCCLRASVIESMLDKLVDHQVGGILGVPASDTLKQVDHHQQVVLTVDRSTIWQAQTPQLFRYGLLREALQTALEKQQAITDEASAIELAGFQPKIVMGHPDNIKVTHPTDLMLAEVILKQQYS